MPRPRVFDEDAAVAAAAAVFTHRGYEGTSVDDLVTALGVHRGSLYRTFGSKLELFHRALARHVELELLPWIAATPDPLAAAAEADRPDPGLLLVAAVERAHDDVVTTQVARVVDAVTAATRDPGLAAALVGLWVLARAGTDPAWLARATATLHPAPER